MPAIKLINSERLNLEKRHKKEHERKFADRIKSILFLDEGWSYEQIAKALLLDLLHRLGFVYKKPKVIPGKANAQKQQEFLNNELQPQITLS